MSCEDQDAVQGGIPMTVRVEGAALPPPLLRPEARLPDAYLPFNAATNFLGG